MLMLEDFAAIDFETANRKLTSICAVGVVVVRGGKLCDIYYHLVRPEPEYYIRQFTLYMVLVMKIQCLNPILRMYGKS